MRLIKRLKSEISTHKLPGRRSVRPPSAKTREQLAGHFNTSVCFAGGVT